MFSNVVGESSGRNNEEPNRVLLTGTYNQVEEGNLILKQ